MTLEEVLEKIKIKIQELVVNRFSGRSHQENLWVSAQTAKELHEHHNLVTDIRIKELYEVLGILEAKNIKCFLSHESFSSELSREQTQQIESFIYNAKYLNKSVFFEFLKYKRDVLKKPELENTTDMFLKFITHKPLITILYIEYCDSLSQSKNLSHNK
ncbi:hypothetical protein AD998_12295 [bacterium 336/3]|nr:hypothetical protein AD998_12295 [bacterium 336/3]